MHILFQERVWLGTLRMFQALHFLSMALITSVASALSWGILCLSSDEPVMTQLCVSGWKRSIHSCLWIVTGRGEGLRILVGTWPCATCEIECATRSPCFRNNLGIGSRNPSQWSLILSTPVPDSWRGSCTSCQAGITIVSEKRTWQLGVLWSAAEVWRGTDFPPTTSSGFRRSMKQLWCMRKLAPSRHSWVMPLAISMGKCDCSSPIWSLTVVLPSTCSCSPLAATTGRDTSSNCQVGLPYPPSRFLR